MELITPTPGKLFVSLCKGSQTAIQAWGRFYTEGIPVPAELQAIRNQHLRYAYDLWQRGITCAAGPSADWTMDISIFAVNSIEEARKAQESDPMYVNGLLHDAKYFEWEVNMPISKASPVHQETLKRSYRELGIIIP